jgi:hypothetical protein
VLVAGCHPEIFVTQKLRHRVDVGAGHPHPTRRSVAQIVKSAIRDLEPCTRPPERDRHLSGADVGKDRISRTARGLDRITFLTLL